SVLLYEGHEDSGSRRLHFASHQHRAEHSFLATILPQSSEWRSVLGDCSSDFLLLLRAAHHIPAAIWFDWHLGDHSVFRKDFFVLRHHGGGLLGRKLLHVFHHAFPISGSGHGIRWADSRSNDALSCPGVGLPLP